MERGATETGWTPPGTIAKSPTGIRGLDEVTGGGFPRGRTTLVCGSAGCGKTVLGVEFLVRGATVHGEPGVLVSFEESADEITANVKSLGFDLDDLRRRKLLAISHVKVERSEIEETGEYDLEGLFIRLAHAVDSVGAKRIVLDTLEALFSGIPNEAVLRAEIRRLFFWLKDRKLTAVVTGERGTDTLTRRGLEEYVSDCVIVLDHRVIDERSTRRLRVVKYRGSIHGTNEYPFLIDEEGFSVIPITSVALSHKASSERISSGIPGLDDMLGGRGFFKGSSVLVSGSAGAGKSSMAACFAENVARQGARVLYLAHEESPDQIARNMRSLGVDLGALDPDVFRLVSNRPSLYGLETHLAVAHKLVNEFDPTVVVVDPISSLVNMGASGDVRLMLTRMIDFLKMRGVTTFLTSLASDEEHGERGGESISSLIDTWIVLHIERRGRERERFLEVVKSRGMPHAEELRPFHLTASGIRVGAPASALGSAK